MLCCGNLSWLKVCFQTWIPAFERRPQVIVQDPRADLEQPMRTLRGPPHLLLLDHPLADHLIDGRFRERRRDPLPMARPIPVIRDEGLVGLDVVVEFTHGLEQLLRPLGSLRRRIEVALQVLDDLQSPVDVAVPEVPLQALQLLLQRGNVPLLLVVVTRRFHEDSFQGQALGLLAHHR